jgi:hypothetical protein
MSRLVKLPANWLTNLSSFAEDSYFRKPENLTVRSKEPFYSAGIMASLLTQIKEQIPTHVDNCSFTSPWKSPLPLGESRHYSVVVYFYSEIWIPISCFSLAEAIALYKKARLLGKELLIYPPDLCPYTQTTMEKLEKQFNPKYASIYTT